MSTDNCGGEQVASSSLVAEGEQVGEEAELGKWVQAGSVAYTGSKEQQQLGVPPSLAVTNPGQ